MEELKIKENNYLEIYLAVVGKLKELKRTG
jgi:hypothetical protein